MQGLDTGRMSMHVQSRGEYHPVLSKNLMTRGGSEQRQTLMADQRIPRTADLGTCSGQGLQDAPVRDCKHCAQKP
eukprot:1160276-Pelagomonas_calceolata.AAC.12